MAFLCVCSRKKGRTEAYYCDTVEQRALHTGHLLQWVGGREGGEVCKNVWQKCIQSVRSFGVRKMPFCKKKEEGKCCTKRGGGSKKKTQQFPFFSVRICSKAGAIFFLSAIGHFASCCPTLPGGIERGPDSVRVFRVFSHSPRTYRKFWRMSACGFCLLGHMDGGSMLHCSCTTLLQQQPTAAI